MNEITPEELYIQVVYTLGRCTPARLAQTDEELVCNLSEEFDIGARSLLHDDSLARLRDAGLIDQETMDACGEVRKRWLSLIEMPWTVEGIRTDCNWLELMEFCNAVKSRFV